ncbi:hypothetical protein [Pedobacter agri]|uniref:hypothetical protein n=1 Tax=Pedobacter agri TaxID=454586 RepID=UPI00278A78DF|nr:hypothetical protein [Pedobacter agri]MDQ1142927.1 hypothetical protein [Pedobacter agri]
MIKKFVLVLFLVLPLISFGQSRGLGISPMHRFFQHYTDSTIVIEYSRLADGRPSFYRLLSKTGDFVNAFKYEPIDSSYYSVFKLKKSMPAVLWNMFLAKRTGFKNNAADINIFFNYVQIDSQRTKKLWREILSFKPWQLVDDETYGAECVGKPAGTTYHNGTWIIHLVTKKEIKTLCYLLPEYFEKQCPGNKNRQAAVQIERLFNEYYPTFNDIKY